jgi:BCCT family betaine/carnitine transporter
MAKKDRFTTSYKVGQDNIQKWGMDMHNPVFFISAALVILFVISTLINPVGAKKLFDASKGMDHPEFRLVFHDFR